MRQHSCASLKLAFSKAFITSLHASLALLWTQDSSVNIVTKSLKNCFFISKRARDFSLLKGTQTTSAAYLSSYTPI